MKIKHKTLQLQHLQITTKTHHVMEKRNNNRNNTDLSTHGSINAFYKGTSRIVLENWHIRIKAMIRLHS